MPKDAATSRKPANLRLIMVIGLEWTHRHTHTPTHTITVFPGPCSLSPETFAGVPLHISQRTTSPENATRVSMGQGWTQTSCLRILKPLFWFVPDSAALFIYDRVRVDVCVTRPSVLGPVGFGCGGKSSGH